MNIIEELKQINVNLNFAVEFRDGLVVRAEIKKIDALILKLSENLNGETLESEKSDFIVRCGTCKTICQQVRPGKWQCPHCE